MTRMRRLFGIVAGVVALLALPLAGLAALAQHDPGTPAAGNMDMADTGTGVVYFTLTNNGDEEDTLVSASTDRAKAVAVHDTVVTNDVGRMVPLDGPLTIPAGESVPLAPGGLHMMLVGLNDDIRPGDTFDLHLTFEHAGKVTVPVTAVFDAEDADSAPVTAGDLVIDGVWSRPAPMINGIDGTPMATPSS